MPHLVYRARARRELAGIAAYIMKESGDRRVAESFVAKLTEHCERLANLPGLLGRARPEFGRNYRSVSFGGYLIVFRYGDDDGPRSHLYIVHVVSGRRDLEPYIRSPEGRDVSDV